MKWRTFQIWMIVSFYCQYVHFVVGIGAVPSWNSSLARRTDRSVIKNASIVRTFDPTWKEQQQGPDNSSRNLVATKITPPRNRHSLLSTSRSFCVWSDAQLRRAVQSATTIGPTLTRINVCARTLKISGRMDPILNKTGINVSNRWISLHCQRIFGRCQFNGQGRYSILYGINATIHTNRIDFVNGQSEATSNDNNTILGSTGVLAFVNSNVDMKRSTVAIPLVPCRLLFLR
jgi:hypothetical protein